MSATTVVSRAANPDLFSQWESDPAFAVSERHPFFSRSGRDYYATTYTSDVDASFAVALGDEPLMIVHCNLHGGLLGLFGQPLMLFARSGISGDGLEKAVSVALKTIDQIALAHAVSAVSIREEISGPRLSLLGRGCVARGATGQIAQHGICDLSLDQRALHRSVRKSFQSLINAGRRDMKMAYVNAGNPDRALFLEYKDFHLRTAGRATRSDESWQSMFDHVVGGLGELALAYIDNDRLVAGTMTFDGSEVTYYASGVYERELFDRPLAHFPLYDAILRSRGRGLKFFDLGALPSKGAGSEKEYNIGFFKRGFATFVEVHLAWRWSPDVR